MHPQPSPPSLLFNVHRLIICVNHKVKKRISRSVRLPIARSEFAHRPWVKLTMGQGILLTREQNAAIAAIKRQQKALIAAKHITDHQIVMPFSDNSGIDYIKNFLDIIVCCRNTGRRRHRSQEQYICARSVPHRWRRTRWLSCRQGKSS